MAVRSTKVETSTIAAVMTSTFLIAQQVAGKAIRDALFLSSFQAKHLPHAMAAASVISLASITGVSALATRYSPQRLLPWIFGGSAIAFVLEWLLLGVNRRGGAFAVYLHTSVLGPIVITMFWSMINERFDPHSAKPAMARIAGGGTLGGVLGGLAAWRASTLMSVPGAILLLGALHLGCAATVIAIPRPKDAEARLLPTGSAEDATSLSALRLLRDAPFLRSLALLVGLGAILSSLLDYILGAQAVHHYGRGEPLLSFFSIFGLSVSLVSLAIQMTLGRLAMQKLALAVHIAVLPGIVLLGGAVGLAVPGLVSAALLRGAEMVHRNTLFRSAYELLYTPVPELQKRATKALIDVGFDRTGTVVGSGLTILVLTFFGGSQTLLLGIVLVLAAATLPVVRQIHRGYVEALAERLREGAEKLAPATSDAAPLSVDPSDVARERIIQSTELLQGKDSSGLERSIRARPTNVLRLGADLLSSDKVRARAALQRLGTETRVLAGHAILLLSDRELQRDARAALRKLAPLIPGQLVDALVASDLDASVRRHIAWLLVAAPGQRAAEGLLLGLADERFEVRYAAGRALIQMLDQRPDIVLSKERVVELVLAEAARAEQIAAATDDDAFLDEDAAPLDIVLRDRVTRGLEHLFTMLGLLMDHDALRLCFRALHQEDDRYRGTALEYLETVLPTDVRDAVWPLLGATTGPLPVPRPAPEVLDDLAKAIRLNRDAGNEASLAAVR